MLNRADVDQDEKRRAMERQAECGQMGIAARELSVGELIDRRIEKAERLLKALHNLKGSLSTNFLHSGASSISAFLEL